MALLNPLHQFSTFNTIFTLSVLTASEVNSPNTTYKVREPSHVILRSGGGATNKTTTYYEDRLGIKLEYFIDNVNIESLVTNNSRTRSSNATAVTFDIIEPYSMGLFLQTIAIAAKEAYGNEYVNYLDTPYLLTIEFIGYDDDGNPVAIQDNLTRHYPIQLTDMQFDVSQSGSQYAVEAIPWNESAFFDQIERTNSDVQITGRTVAEVLQDGPYSLSTVLNANLQRQVAEGKEVEADSIAIIFPTSISSGNNLGTLQATQIDAASQNLDTNNQGIPGAVITGFQTGVLDSGVGQNTVDPSIKNYVDNFVREQSDDFGVAAAVGLNDFGAAKIIDGFQEQGRTPMPFENKQYKNDVFDRSDITLDNELRVYSYGQNTKITKIIEDVILSSKWGQGLTSISPDANGYVDWFRVQSKVLLDSNKTQQRHSGRLARTYIYEVVPYKVHMSTIQLPTAGGPGYGPMRSSVAKEYNYIYTGENSDILNFDIRLNAAFFVGLKTDLGNINNEHATGATQDNARQTAVEYVQVEQGGGSENPGGLAKTGNVLSSNTSSAGGNGISNSKIAAAQQFHNLIINSDVDLLELDLDIFGDPYFMADSGMGNYNSPEASLFLNSDGSLDYQRSETSVLVQFRTPIDYNETGGMYFPEDQSIAVDAFSGLYRVLSITNTISGGKFTQRLNLLRLRNQDEVPEEESTPILQDGASGPYSPFD
jgi:hypothetical protein